jgi:uncharacterized coiled-coil protein SlyX
MSLEETVAAQLKRIEQLTAENTRRKETGRKVKAENEALIGRLAVAEAGKAAPAEAPASKPEAKAKPGQTDDRDAKIARLETEIRTNKHRDAFRSEAVKGGAKPTSVDHLWRLSDYTAEGDEIDPAKITEVVERLRSEIPDFFTPSPDATGKPPVKLPPGPGANRGTPPKPGNTPETFVVTKANARDYGWMLANKSKIADAQKAGTLSVEAD